MTTRTDVELNDAGDVVRLVVTSDEPITGTTLRTIRVDELRRLALMPREQHAPRASGHDIAVARDDGPTPRTLDAVAIEYRAAAAVGLPTTLHLVETFGAPRSTIGYWVRLARERGYL